MSDNPLLTDIMKYMFYAVELNLYLDNFPTNSKATKDYKMVSEKLDSLICQYEQSYGPLTNFGNVPDDYPWDWVDNPWPWDNEFYI